MPVTRRQKLLAGVAMLLALGVAGPGCQSRQECRTCVASSTSYHSPPLQTGGSPAYGYGENAVARNTFPIQTLRTAGNMPIVCQSNCNPASSASDYAAVMLRPVPITPAYSTPTDSSTSTWSPVQRVSSEMPPLADPVTPVASIERPMPSGTMSMQTPLGAPLLPVPPLHVPSAMMDGRRPDKPDKGDTPDKREKGDRKEKDGVLPRPTPVNGNGKKDVYPLIPPAVITHPTEAPREFQMRALSAYIVEPPDILTIEVDRDVLATVRLSGQALVRPDGTIGFDTLPPVFVAGLTLEQIKYRLAEAILPFALKDKDLTLNDILRKTRIDVLRYNSKFYYVITDGGGYGEPVQRIPITGNERVLDAVAQIQGLPAVASKKRIWIARATPHDVHPLILPVDWCSIVQGGSASTNYQLFPGDRLYIHSDPKIRIDSALGKILAPVERVLGVTLLGSGVVNSIRSSGSGGGNNNNAGNVFR